MPNTIPEIAALIEEVEKKYGRKVSTSTDFESLSVVIEREIGEYVSASTLKRIWGYVSLRPAPRVATLDILCRFCGHASFSAYREFLKSQPGSESGFFRASFISSSELEKGDRLLIGWLPNRLVQLEYLGGDKYTVISSENSKLRAGDRFSASQFLLGYPLYIDGIERAEGRTPSYVAGKSGGLNRLERI